MARSIHKPLSLVQQRIVPTRLILCEKRQAADDTYIIAVSTGRPILYMVNIAPGNRPLPVCGPNILAPLSMIRNYDPASLSFPFIILFFKTANDRAIRSSGIKGLLT